MIEKDHRQTCTGFSLPNPNSSMHCSQHLLVSWLGASPGVKSRNRQILRLQNCTFTYEGNSSPTLRNVTISLTLGLSLGGHPPTSATGGLDLSFATGAAAI